MLKKILASILVVAPIIISAKTSYGLSKNNPEYKSVNENISNYIIRPYDKALQESVLNSFNNFKYYYSKESFDLIKDIYLNSKDHKIKKTALSLVERDDIDLKKDKEVYLKNSNDAKFSIIHEKFIKESDSRKGKEIEKRTKVSKKSPWMQKFYRLYSYLELGDIESAKKYFRDNIDRYVSRRNYKAFFSNKSDYGRIYALAFIFESDNKKKIGNLLNSDKDLKNLYHYYSYKVYKSQEKYNKSILHLNILLKEYTDKELTKEILSLYKHQSTRDYLNSNFAGSWAKSREGVMQASSNKDKENVSTGVSLKRLLLNSSAKYIAQLSSMGEFSHAKRVQVETKRVLALPLQ